MASLLHHPTLERGVIDLSANENPLGPSPKVAQAITDEVDNLHRYPSREGTRLRNLLANQLLIECDHLLLGNGACELLDMAARALLLPGDEALIPTPSFLPYQKVVQRCGAKVVELPLTPDDSPLEAILNAITPRTRIILLGNPNNPTGGIISEAALRRFMAKLPSRVTLVIDEAYREYVIDPRYPDSVGLVQEGANLLVVRSLSKAYALAGLRIGYAVAAKGVIARLTNHCQFFNTNALAQTAACAALNDHQHLRKTRLLNREGISYLSQALADLGFRVWPSQANFVLFQVSEVQADRLQSTRLTRCLQTADSPLASGERLHHALMRRGIRLKSGSQFGLADCLRVSTGLMPDNRAFIAHLSSLLTAEATHRACV